jgi:hypothetical protein
MKIKNWTACVQDREQWKEEVLWEGQNCQQLKKVQRLEEEEEWNQAGSYYKFVITDSRVCVVHCYSWQLAFGAEQFSYRLTCLATHRRQWHICWWSYCDCSKRSIEVGVQALHRRKHTVSIPVCFPVLLCTGPEGSRRLRFPDFKTVGIGMWYGCQPHIENFSSFLPRIPYSCNNRRWTFGRNMLQKHSKSLKN